jgi:ribonuclease D
MTSSQHQYLDKQADLERYCVGLRALRRFAFDTEFIRDETFEPALCLVQVATDEGVTLIDPLELDMAPFWDVVAAPRVVKIVHSGKEDFDVGLRTSGRLPRSVFDVQIAAGFVGLPYPMSLSRLVEQLLDRKLAKGHTLTDWSRRPLTPEQLRYAVEDVAHLLPMFEKLSRKIRAMQREAWAREEFQRFELEATYMMPPEERAIRIKGRSRLDGLGLLVLERLVSWREAWAKKKNRPIRALVRDDILVEIARRRPTERRELEILRGFPQARNVAICDEILALIREASNVPVAERPKPAERQDDGPMIGALLDLISAVVQCVCHEDRLAWSLLGSTQRLREVLDFHAGRLKERPPLLTGWRDVFIGEHLIDLLEGRSAVSVSGWPDNIRIELERAGK